MYCCTPKALYNHMRESLFNHHQPMLKTVVLPNIFVETMTNFIFQNSLMNRKFTRTAFEIEIFLIHYTFCYINLSLLTNFIVLLNKSVNFFQSINQSVNLTAYFRRLPPSLPSSLPSFLPSFRTKVFHPDPQDTTHQP